jgi:hypothetical protein
MLEFEVMVIIEPEFLYFEILLISSNDQEFAFLQEYKTTFAIKDVGFKRHRFKGDWLLEKLDRSVEYSSFCVNKPSLANPFEALDECKQALLQDLQRFIKELLADRLKQNQ